MSSRIKKPHFVPRSYLNQFADLSKKIWVYDFKKNKFYYQHTSNVAIQKNLYHNTRHPNPLDISLVTNLENQAKIIIDKIKSGDKPSPVDMGHLLNFIALQYFRTPSAKKRTDMNFAEFWSKIRKIYTEKLTKESIRITKLEDLAQNYLYDQKIVGISPQQFLETDMKILPPTNLFLETLIVHGYSMVNLIAKKHLEFLYTDNANPFILNDDPFNVFGSEQFTAALSNISVIPLSKNLCLSFSGNNPKISSKKMLPWAVKVINMGFMIRSKNNIYSHSKEVLINLLKELPKFKEDPLKFVYLK